MEKFSIDNVFSKQPVNISICSTKTGELLGEFKENDGLLTFECKVDEAGEVFIDFICETFNKRIDELRSNTIK